MKMLFAAAAAVFGLAAAALPRPAAAETLEIGYMPILPVAQVFVAIEEGWLKAAGIDAKLVQFQNGPAMVQALLAGQLDVAHFGIGPTMVARAKGADLKVVASSTVEQISIVALPKLAAAFARGDKAGAFARFTASEGRKPVIATFPTGSVPEVVLSYWIERQLGLQKDSIDVIYQGAAQVQQALLTGAVDGAAILEPIVALTLAKVEGAAVVASGNELFPGQPGAVLVVREALIARSPEAVAALVDAHVRATAQLRDAPALAAAAVGKYVGGGRMPADIVRQSLENARATFVADPDYIVEGTQRMNEYQEAQGTLAEKVDLNALFEPRFYRALAGRAAN
jgi:NitT/TauT family transport system substrate-binding protein